MDYHHFIRVGLTFVLIMGCSDTASRIASDIEESASAAKTQDEKKTPLKKDVKTINKPPQPKKSSTGATEPRSMKNVAVQPTNSKPPKDKKLSAARPNSKNGSKIDQCRSRCNRLKAGSRNECLRSCRDSGSETASATRTAPKIMPVSPALAKCRRACNQMKDGQRNACMRRCK